MPASSPRPRCCRPARPTPTADPPADFPLTDATAEPSTRGLPYWRLSGFYFFYFAILGALVPYWSLYLQAIDFSSVQIGYLMALIMITRIVAPNVGGWVSDRIDQRMVVVRVASVLTVIIFTGMFMSREFMWIAAIMTGFSFFWNAALPQFEANTLNHLGRDSRSYGRVRAWGSVGFIGVVVGAGFLLEHQGIELVVPILMAMMIGTLLASLVVPDSAAPHAAQHKVHIGRLLRRPEVIAFFLACCLMQASHGPFYTFFSIYLEEQGYGRGLVGSLWALGVVAEVGIFVLVPRLLPRMGAARLLQWSLALAVVRWLVIGRYVDSLPALVFAQVLHAATFGMYHATAMAVVHRLFTGSTQGRGQALYSSLSFGAGGALGGLYSGYTWDWIGAASTFYIAAGLAALGWLIAVVGLRGRDEAAQ